MQLSIFCLCFISFCIWSMLPFFCCFRDKFRVLGWSLQWTWYFYGLKFTPSCIEHAARNSNMYHSLTHCLKHARSLAARSGKRVPVGQLAARAFEQLGNSAMATVTLEFLQRSLLQNAASELVIMICLFLVEWCCYYFQCGEGGWFLYTALVQWCRISVMYPFSAVSLSPRNNNHMDWNRDMTQ